MKFSYMFICSCLLALLCAIFAHYFLPRADASLQTGNFFSVGPVARAPSTVVQAPQCAPHEVEKESVAPQKHEDERRTRFAKVESWLRDLQNQEMSIVFDLDLAVKSQVEQHTELVSELVEILESPLELEESLDEVQMMRTAPQCVRDRMMALDVLWQLASSGDATSASRHAKEAIFSRASALPRAGAPHPEKRILVVEQCEALAAAARLDRERAAHLFARISHSPLGHALRECLRYHFIEDPFMSSENG